MFLYFILVFFVALADSSDKVRYDDYALYRVHPKSEEHVMLLKDLKEETEKFDFWTNPRLVDESVTIAAPPETRNDFEHFLSNNSLHYDLVLDNIQQAFDSQTYSRRKRSIIRQTINFEAYLTMQNIYEWFEHLSEAHGDLVTLVQAGSSHEGRNITGVKISRGSSSNKKAFFLGAGEIGADWLSPAVVTYMVDQLVRGEDPEALAASEEFEWHIFPLINPDGFEYSQNVDRIWRKNRRPTSNGNIGVDLTKNWNSQWGVSGGSFDPSSAEFIGLGPFSEPETRQISDYIEQIGSRLVGLLSFRGFGQKLLVPFAHTSQPIYNYNEMITIGRRAMGSMAVRYNTRYEVDTSANIHDGATGSMGDWAKYRYYPAVVATYLLRDDGTYGFVLPVSNVLPSCQETYDSLMAIIREGKFIKQL